MRFFKAIIPNLTIAMALALITIAILNEFNPRLGLFSSKATLIFIIICGILSIVSASQLYSLWRMRTKQNPKH